MDRERSESEPAANAEATDCHPANQEDAARDRQSDLEAEAVEETQPIAERLIMGKKEKIAYGVIAVVVAALLFVELAFGGHFGLW